MLTFKWKIVFSMWMMAALSTIIAGTISGWVLIKSHEKTMKHQLKSTATTLMSLGIEDYSGLKGFQEMDRFIEETLHLARVNQIIQVYTQRGKMMFSSLASAGEDFQTIFSPTEKPVFRDHEGLSRRYKLFIAPYRAKAGKNYYLQIAMPYPLYHEVLRTTFWEVLLIFLLLFVIAFLISQLLARRLIKPVRDIAVYLNRLNPSQAGDSEWKPLLMPKGGEHMTDIAQGINALTRRIKSTLYGMSRISLYLAHELRNPLAILTGEAEMTLKNPKATTEEYRSVLKSSLEEIERINAVVSTLLAISKKERKAFDPHLCPLNDWLKNQKNKWEELLDQKIEWEISSQIVVVVLDAGLLHRLLDNLMRNIRDHTPPKTLCRIRLAKTNEGACITVEDNGGGMSPDLLEALNQRNLQHEKIGIGLGLCLSIASVCNFQITFGNKPNNGGLKVEILLEG